MEAGDLRSWEQWFLRATPAQQQEMLALCRQQGFLFADQVPWDGSEAPGKEREDELGRRTKEFFAGNRPQRATGGNHQIEYFDGELDSFQREAVRRALSTPDIFLLEGLPGSGKSRTVAEILRQAEHRGRRVLFLARWAAGLDASLERLEPAGGKLRLRFAETPPTSTELRAYVPEEALRLLGERLLGTARGICAQKEETCRSHQDAQALWGEYRSTLDRQRNLQGELADLESRLDSVEEEVGNGTATGEMDGPEQRKARALLENDLEGIRRRLADLKQEGIEQDRLLSDLAALACDLESGRWWTPGWWKAYFRRGRLERRGELREQVDRRRREAAGLEEEQAVLCERLADLEAEDRATERRRTEEAIAVRRTDLEERRRRTVAALQEEQDRSTRLAGELGLNGSAASPEKEHQDWVSRRAQEEENRRLAQAWLAYLETGRADLEGSMQRTAGLVAATLTRWAEEPDLHPRPGFPVYDLLVVEDAQTLTEAEIIRLTSLGSALILVAGTDRDAAEAGCSKGASAPRLLQANGFVKLWRTLVGFSRGDATTWTQENGSLCCRFQPAEECDPSRLETEHLHDNPAIELRILAGPQPVLAQVAFPAAMGLAEAMRFLVEELQEHSLPRRGSFLWMEDRAEGRRVHLGVPDPGEAPHRVDLEEGLVATLTTHRTFHLDFGKESWDGPRVEEWLCRHFGQVDLGRAMFLGRLHRQRSALGGWLGEILFPRRHQERETPSPHPFLEIHPVPPLPRPSRPRDGRRGRVGEHLSLPKEGAGLEIDLGSARSGGRIPNEVFAALPRRGIANYLEGHALVRRLEHLLAAEPVAADSLGVVALQEGQAILLRRLVAGSAILKERNIPVGLPEDFRHREFDTVLLGLTRSHSHRSVAYAADPEDLVQAMTRARRRLLVFLDPGSLVRRAGWQGPLEHLDGEAAAREAALLGRLLQSLRRAVSCMATGQ